MTIAHAVNSSDLRHYDHKMADADVLQALAHSNPLGVALLHVRDGNQANRYNECLELFRRECVRHVRDNRSASIRKINRTIVAKAAEIVLREFLIDICPVCLGADLLDYGERRKADRRKSDTAGSISHGVVGDRRKGDRRFICPKCSGTRRAKIDHVARRHALGIGRDRYDATFERLLPEFSNILICAERGARARTGQKLGRYHAIMADGGQSVDGIVPI